MFIELGLSNIDNDKRPRNDDNDLSESFELGF